MLDSANPALPPLQQDGLRGSGKVNQDLLLLSLQTASKHYDVLMWENKTFCPQMCDLKEILGVVSDTF